MRSVVLITALGACSFEGREGALPDAPTADATEVDGPAVDAPVDAPPPVLCPPGDDDLRVCFSFDEMPLPTSLVSAGTAAVTATLAEVTRIERSSTSGAAQLATTSGISMPMGSGVSGVLTGEIWFRADTLPSTEGQRMGLYDSNTSPNISLFLYRAGAGYTLRCGLGGQTEVFNAALVQGAWHYVACTCDGGAMGVYLDGALVEPARQGGCNGGAFAGDGFTIGADNSGNGGTVAGDRLLGAVDGVRLWAAPRTASEIAATAQLAW